MVKCQNNKQCFDLTRINYVNIRKNYVNIRFYSLFNTSQKAYRF